MTKRVFIIHGWEGSPQEGWFPWLKKKLEAEGVEVHVPAMPDPAHPTIDTWVSFLKHVVGRADEQTFMVGHSIGCQAILRYLETLPAGVKVGGVVLVAGWVTLKPVAMEDEDAAAVATPWLERPLNWPKIRSHFENLTAIMSDDDQYVPVEDGKLFVRELGAKLVIEHQKRHLGGEDGVMVLTSVVKSLKGMMNQ
ncbi:MAG: alpha/beta fold hydrolase [Patescibacteria group bacterium]